MRAVRLRISLGVKTLRCTTEKVDFDLIEPARMDRRVNEHEVRPAGLQALTGPVAAMRGPVVHDPEDAASRPIGGLTHDLGDQALKGRDAGGEFAAAKHFRAVHVPGRQICPCSRPFVLVLHEHGPARRGRQRGMDAPARLNAGLLVGAQDVFTSAHGVPLPPSFVEIQDAASFGGKVPIAWKDPAAMPPGLQGILTEPAPHRGPADLGDDASGDHFSLQLGDGPPRQRQSLLAGRFTRQRLDLDDDAGGKSGLGARLEAVLRGRVIGPGKIACAIC